MVDLDALGDQFPDCTSGTPLAACRSAGGSGGGPGALGQPAEESDQCWPGSASGPADLDRLQDDALAAADGPAIQSRHVCLLAGAPSGKQFLPLRRER